MAYKVKQISAVSTPQTDTGIGDTLPPRDINWTALMVLFLGALMSILNASTLNVAIPKLMVVFNSTTAQIQWVLTGYMLVMGVVVPLTGFLGDRYGYKKTYIVSLTLFVLGSALCGLAWSTHSLVAMRIIQGIGGGMVMPLTMSMIYRIVPREKIGLALGIWGMAGIAAPALGPTVGGYIVEYLNWRLLFYVNLPFGIAGLLLSIKYLEETKKNPNLKFDYPGIVLSSVGLFTLLLGLSEGTDKGWESTYIVSLLTTAVVTLTAFIIYELKVSEPMLDLRLFKNRTFTASTLISFISTIGLFGGVFLIPLYMQDLRQFTALESGELMLLPGLVTAAIMPISGKLFDVIGPKPLIITGLILLGYATYLFHDLSLATSLGTIQLWLIIRSLGMGLALMPATTAGMNTVTTEKVGRASALTNVLRQVSGSLGIAIITTLLVNRQNFHSTNSIAAADETSILVQQAQAMLVGMFSKIQLPAAELESLAKYYLYGLIQQNAFINAIDDVFLVVSLITFLGILPVLMMKRAAHR